MTAEDSPFWNLAGGSRIAIREQSGRSWAYEELSEAVDKHVLATAPRSLHVLEMNNHLSDVVTLIAGLRHRHVMILASNRDRANVLASQFCAEMIWNSGTAEHTGFSSPLLHPDLALMLSTSGSTGSGKCVRLSYENIASNATAIAAYLQLDSAESTITSLPLHYSYGLSVLNSHLTAGGSVTLSNHSVTTPEFGELIRRDEVTSIAGVPHSYELLERIGFRDRAPGSLKTLTQAGGRLDPSKVETFRSWIAARGGRMFVMYGQTEATARIAYVPPELLAERQGFIGVPIPGGTLTLVNENGSVIDTDGLAGELVYQGPNVMMGYANASEDLAQEKGPSVLPTGDLAVREDGLFRLVGRKSRFTKMYGLRIDLDEIEARLRKQGADAAVAGNDQQMVIATTSSAKALVAVIVDELSMPRGSVHHLVTETIPRLPSGKIDYSTILRSADKTKPVTRDVFDLFSKTFQRGTITEMDCFADLGGDSLTYVTFSVELEELIGWLPDRWDEMTIAQLQTAEVPFGKRVGLETAVPTDMALRTVGIASVVANHASNWPVGGGVAALIMLSGYSLSRFQRTQLMRGEWRGFLQSWSITVFLPYILLLISFAIAVKPLPSSLFVLTANYDDNLRGFAEPFWYISAYSQLILVTVGAAALIPAVRTAIAQTPFRAGLLVVGCSTATLILAHVAGHAPIGRGLIEILPLAALGWCAAQAHNRRRQGLVMVACCLVAILETAIRARQGWDVNFLLLHLAWWTLPVGFLLFKPALRIPRLIKRAIVTVSAASFTIYLIHTLPIWIAAQATHRNPGLWAAFLAIAFGVALHQSARRATQWLRNRNSTKHARNRDRSLL